MVQAFPFICHTSTALFQTAHMSVTLYVHEPLCTVTTLQPLPHTLVCNSLERH